jgi:CubicO group peptidase (beta-lactamase class C family)
LKRFLRLLPAILVVHSFLIVQASAGYFPGKAWRTVEKPEDAGWSSKKLRLVQQCANKMDSVGGMVLFDGKIVCKWGDIKKRSNIHSARKSIMSALYGIYVSDGKIDLNKTMGQLGIDDKEPKLSSLEERARIIDLLQARSGVYHHAAAETASMQNKMPERGSHAPGTFWFYNNWDFNTLGVIFEKLTGTKIGVAFKNRIAAPTGMQDFREKDVTYQYSKESLFPAYIFSLTARDMARFGLLFMYNGKWMGKQVIPSDWVIKSTTYYSKASGSMGYGYMWWVGKKAILGVRINYPAYCAAGNGGNFIIVLPTKKLVIVNKGRKDKKDVSGVKKFRPLLKLILADNPN